MIDASMPNQTRDADVPDIVGFLRRIATNILAGARVAYFRPFSGREFNVGAWHIFVLVVIDVCIAVAYDYVSIEPDRYFSMYGFMHAATTYLLLVFAVKLADVRLGLRFIGPQDLAHSGLLRLLRRTHRVVDIVMRPTHRRR